MTVFAKVKKTQQTSIDQCTVIQPYFCWTETKILNPMRSDFKYPKDFRFLRKCRIPSDSESVTSLTNADIRTHERSEINSTDQSINQSINHLFVGVTAVTYGANRPLRYHDEVNRRVRVHVRKRNALHTAMSTACLSANVNKIPELNQKKLQDSSTDFVLPWLSRLGIRVIQFHNFSRTQIYVDTRSCTGYRHEL